MSITSLETLPVELLYRIIDILDAKTIFLSFRYVCKRFYAIVNNQNRYQLDFRYISKLNFYQVCHLIHPENVVKLILSDENETVGQIQLFLSIFNLNLFIHLTSLTLIRINHIQLKIFFNHIITCSIISLSIEYQNEQILDTSTIDLISLTIEKLPILRKFQFTIQYLLNKNIQWPIDCSIQHLTLNCCTLYQFFIILRDLSHLQTLVLYDLDFTEIFLIPSSSLFLSSLKSLSIEQSLIDIKKIQYFLLLTPSLIYLKLTGWPSSNISLNGTHWEEFIQKKLLNLKKFEFFFRIILQEQTIDTLQLIITSYQTFFWLEDKHWYITCDYMIDTSTLHLYSIPICEKKYILDSDLNKITYSTLNQNIIDRRFIMDHISHLHINFISQSNIQYFSNVRELTLYITDNWPENSIEYFSIIMNLSNLIKLSLNSDPNEYSVHNTIVLITDLIERTNNLQSIIISYPLSCNMEWICKKISNKIKHAEIDLFTRNHTKEQFTQLRHLSSVTLRTLRNYHDCILYLEKKNCTYRKNASSISLWLGRNQDDLFKTKRIKLIDHENFS